MDSKVLFLGMGVVGQSLLNIIKKENLFPDENILVADSSRQALDYFIEAGGKKDNAILFEMNSRSYKEIFNYLKEDDYLLCLADGNDCVVLVEECNKRRIHFVSASDDTFDDVEDEEDFRYLDHFNLYKKLAINSRGSATSILQFGVNPGFVSILAKKALIDIVENDAGDFVSGKRDYFKELLESNNYSQLARELGVTAFIETDLDTTKSSLREDINTVYSTWNVPDFDAEMDDRTIIKVGTNESLSAALDRIGVNEDKIFYYNKSDGTLVLDLTGKQVKAKAFDGSRVFEGCVDAHEEVFTIHDYFSVRDTNGDINYAPSVMFVYSPCELAVSSVNHGDNEKYQLITKEFMTSGGESVGIVAVGDKFKPRYVGTKLSYDENSFETPSVLLVSASLSAALKYIINHPKDGIMFPEYPKTEEIISYAKEYLPIISVELNENV